MVIAWIASLMMAVFLCGCTAQAPDAGEDTGAPEAAAAGQRLQGKKVVLIIARQKFRDEELVEPRKLLAAEGAEVTVASSSLKEATGMLGTKAKADVLIDDVNAADYDAIVFVGGMGASEYYGNAKALELCQSAVAQGKLLAAICIAPGTLAKAGVLKGKKATCWKGSAAMLKQGGATFTGKAVEVDGRIITANGPKAAPAFARAIADALEQ